MDRFQEHNQDFQEHLMLRLGKIYKYALSRKFMVIGNVEWPCGEPKEPKYGGRSLNVNPYTFDNPLDQKSCCHLYQYYFRTQAEKFRQQ